MTIANEVIVKLDKAIRELLKTGMDTGRVRDLLSREQSFGKYDGCTPQAIFDRANSICREINARTRAENRVILAAATESLRRNFPDMAKYFRR